MPEEEFFSSKQDYIDEIRFYGDQLIEASDAELKLSGSTIKKPDYQFPANFEERVAASSFTTKEVREEAMKAKDVFEAFEWEIKSKRKAESALIELRIKEKTQEMLEVLLECEKELSIKKLGESVELISSTLKYCRELRADISIVGHIVYLDPKEGRDLNEIEEQFIKILKDSHVENYSALLVAQAIFGDKTNDPFCYNNLSEANLQAFQELSKIKLLINIPKTSRLSRALVTGMPTRLPFGGEAFRVPNFENLFIIPLAALECFESLEMDHLDLRDISSAELETLLVLYGGAAYPSLRDAREAARDLV